MERLLHVYDCTNSLLFFEDHVLDEKNELINVSAEHYTKTVRTISSPAIIIELNGDARIRYYFRAVYWDKTLLIGARLINGTWIIKEYFENPSGYFVLSLMKKNLLQGSVTLIQTNEDRVMSIEL
ncbi:hypothetical protein [Longitalea luteola]|uniref:hypothetical protein n=1 Tax=Longitalea luteola TaxID=2812563 RepID=UPI001A9648D0|nr:hypothetical protein [Longitalea luteola]